MASSLVHKGQDLALFNMTDPALGVTLGRALCVAQAENIKPRLAESDILMDHAIYTDISSTTIGVDVGLIKDIAEDEEDEAEDMLAVSAAQFDMMSFAGDPDDDELTSLAWLQDANLLRNITSPGYGYDKPFYHALHFSGSLIRETLY